MGKIAVKINKKKDKVTVINKIKYPEVVSLQLIKLIESRYFPQFKTIKLKKYKENKKAIMSCEVEKMMSLDTFLNTPINELDFYRIAYNIVNTLLFCDEQMLNSTNLELRLDLIFIEPVLYNLSFLYWPVVNNNSYIKPRNFFLMLNNSIKFDNNTVYFKEYSAYLNSLSVFSLNNFKRMLEKFLRNMDKSIDASRQQKVVAKESLTETEVVRNGDLVYNPLNGVFHRKQNSSNKGTTILSNTHFEKKEVFNNDAPQLRTVYLTRIMTNERFRVDSKVFSIGKSSNCNLTINNSVISRVHAKIFMKQGKVYLRDNGSTNHSYINGISLTPGKDYELKHGFRFRLANEDFTITISE